VPEWSGEKDDCASHYVTSSFNVISVVANS